MANKERIEWLRARADGYDFLDYPSKAQALRDRANHLEAKDTSIEHAEAFLQVREKEDERVAKLEAELAKHERLVAGLGRAVDGARFDDEYRDAVAAARETYPDEKVPYGPWPEAE